MIGPSCVIKLIGACSLLSAVQTLIVATSDRSSGDQAAREPEGSTFSLFDTDLGGESHFSRGITDESAFETRRACHGYTCKFSSTCGRAPLNPLSRQRSSVDPYIINGEDQIYGEWPSFAMLLMTFEDSSGSLGCGGVLISNKHVLTAAHCIYKPDNTPASSVEVILGAHYTYSDNLYEKRFEASTVCIYTELEEKLRNIQDWAVLTLMDEVQFNDYIQPACLPYGFNSTSQYKHCHLVGWGDISEEKNEDGSHSFPEVIQKMPVRRAPCYKDHYETETFACYEHAKLGSNGFYGDSHLGDSGGPILCLDAITRRWTVIATLSGGNDAKKGLDFYIKTTALLPDIKAMCGI